MSLDLSRQVVLRWNDGEPKHASLLQEAAVNCVLLARPDEVFERACRAAGIETIPEDQIEFVSVKELESAKPGKPVALTDGEWPGVSREPN